MSENPIYQASVYTRNVTYTNFQGDNKSIDLYFALDPLQLLTEMAGFKVGKVKSGNPARNGQQAEITEEQQLRFIRDLASKAAGTPSEDGESWTPFEDFANSLVGKAFLVKLASSDGDRREFAETVILDPFRAFVAFAIADKSNTEKDVLNFKVMLQQMENIFKMPEESDETPEQKRARLQADLAALDTGVGQQVQTRQVPPAE